MNKTFVTPADGQDLTELAQTLIGLAEHPHDVVWSTREAGFEVPEQVAQAYAETVNGQLEQMEKPERTSFARPRAARATRERAPRRKKTDPVAPSTAGSTEGGA